MRYKCKCGIEYNESGQTWDEHDQRWRSDSMDISEWGPAEGRCQDCLMLFFFSMYGGWMEPTFLVNGTRYMANESFPDEPIEVPELPPSTHQKTPIGQEWTSDDAPF